MRGFTIVTTCLLLTACSLGDSGIRYGEQITVVQHAFGLPDVISDRSGDLERLYTPQNRPPQQWPASAPRSFYYLDRDLAVTFVHGKARSASRITPDRRETILAVME
ncbi:MAG: hypothetical protein WD534_16660 [Phycisphaeraceae bacterium]